MKTSLLLLAYGLQINQDHKQLNNGIHQEPICYLFIYYNNMINKYQSNKNEDVQSSKPFPIAKKYVMLMIFGIKTKTDQKIIEVKNHSISSYWLIKSQNDFDVRN